MDTPMKEVMEDQAIWSAIVQVFATYYPAMPFGAAGSHMGSLSLNQVLQASAKRQRGGHAGSPQGTGRRAGRPISALLM